MATEDEAGGAPRPTVVAQVAQIGAKIAGPASAAVDACAFAPRCPRADEECRSVLPRLDQRDDRLVACHHPVERAASTRQIGVSGG